MPDQITPLPVSISDASAAGRIDRAVDAPRGAARPARAALDIADAPARAELRAPAAGFHAILDAALGQPHLPDPIALIAALEAAHAHAPNADKAVPGLGKLVEAVIEDETYKLGRYLDLSAL